MKKIITNNKYKLKTNPTQGLHKVEAEIEVPCDDTDMNRQLMTYAEKAVANITTRNYNPDYFFILISDDDIYYNCYVSNVKCNDDTSITYTITCDQSQIKNKTKVMVGIPDTEKHRGYYDYYYEEMELTGQEILQHILKGNPIYTMDAFCHHDSIKY